ncbi:GNAT family N-acetyltransferase [Anaerocolumna sp. MB42-C2]|uniref:GNAT family N-acetyltransferase n=1 Tax=Anaerocolumna sp. MB42-C2 TaxID=3070997 RepID=UPI0027E16A15|nr:GNAT family N-acetyltransferase [Anaerocolumna sp. MB42-C2]WMJ88357.1 GNAT family N-acetyltransferase [Anaerocolumna sp. MB42-C2]
MSKMNPFEQCQSFETVNFQLRKTIPEDAEDLLQCYSDQEAVKFFNADNCHTNFYFQTLNEMLAYMNVWEREYLDKVYVRFSIIDKSNKRVIGIIEFCPWLKKAEGFGKLGVLRLDISSSYEKEEIITELIKAVNKNLYDLFQVNKVFTKAIPTAIERISALLNCGYSKLENGSIIPYGD